METPTKEIGPLIRGQGREYLLMRMVKSMKVSLEMVIWMDGARTTTQMGIPTKEIG